MRKGGRENQRQAGAGPREAGREELISLISEACSPGLVHYMPTMEWIYNRKLAPLKLAVLYRQAVHYVQPLFIVLTRKLRLACEA